MSENLENNANLVSANPLNEPFRQKKPRKKQYVLIGVFIALIIFALFSSYLVALNTIVNAVSTFEISTGEVEITNFSIVPLYADFDGNFIIKNPSNIDFQINRIKTEILIENNGNRVSIGAIDVSDKAIPANGFVIIPATLHLDSELLNLFGTQPPGFEIFLNGIVSASGKYLFWTISYEDTKSFKLPEVDFPIV